MSQHDIETTRQEIKRLTRTNVVTSTTITQLWTVIVAITSALLILTRHYYDSIMDYIIEIRSHIDILESTDPSDKARLGTNHPTTTTAKPTSRSPIKCTKCHARGHSANACRSKDPAAVRRRIAANRKARGRCRAAGELAPAPIPSWSPLFHHPTLPQHALMALPGSSNIISEAAELRRCAAQSSRDRCQARKAKAATSSQP
ncbi:hypothetical protein C0993_002455 [Termitomyces sp. T159_Od127]|nr:hypothetical protein C0993_002455 [Termitomyces sp. T159_Od127]